MSNIVLPKIKVIGAPSLEGSTVAASLSPGSTTDGGHTGGPRSPSSSEGVLGESMHALPSSALVECSSYPRGKALPRHCAYANWSPRQEIHHSRILRARNRCPNWPGMLPAESPMAQSLRRPRRPRSIPSLMYAYHNGVLCMDATVFTNKTS